MYIKFYYRWLLLQTVIFNASFVLITAKGGRGGGGRSGGRGGGRGGGGGWGGSSSSRGSGSSSSGSSSSSSGSGSSGYGSKPSPSYSRPSSSNSQPSQTYPRPSSSHDYGGHSHSYVRPHHHHSWPSHSSYGSDYEPTYGPPSYDWYDKKEPYRPFATFPPMEPFTIPSRIIRPLGDPYWDTYERNRPGDCEPFSSLNMDCPPGYKELQSHKSILDIALSNDEYENRKPWTFSTTKRPQVEDDCGPYAFSNIPCPPGYRSYLESRKPKYQCSPYSEYNLPCPPDYEPYAKPEVSTKPSRSTTKSIAENKKSFYKPIKNIRPYSCSEIRYLEHYLGGYTWEPSCGSPMPVYMNYVGIPTGVNMNGSSPKRKGFIGSLISVSNSSEQVHQTLTKYHGSYPTPYGIKHLKKWGEEYVNEHFLGKHSTSASLYTIFPFMTAKSHQENRNMHFHPVPIFKLPRRFRQHRYLYSIEDEQVMNTEYSEYFNVFGEDYIGMCQQPLKKNLSKIECESTLYEIKCNATCKNGYNFPENTEFMMNRCWHVTGVWRPQKNFPMCKPLCDEPCQNGGTCIKHGKCKCTPEFRGNRCEFHFLRCDIRILIPAGERMLSWVCHHSTNETVCNVKCKEPTQFEYPSAGKYKCTPNGLWTPNVLPRCIVKEDQ